MSEQDGEDVEEVHKKVGDFSPEAYYEELKNAINIFDEDRFVQWKDRVKLIEGNIEQTASQFVKDNPGIRFSLVHFDCDLYEPTMVALKAFWPRLSKGGVFLFDEYAIKDWPGETRAVDDFFEDKPVVIKKLQWNNVPAGYIIKE